MPVSTSLSCSFAAVRTFAIVARAGFLVVSLLSCCLQEVARIVAIASLAGTRKLVFEVPRAGLRLDQRGQCFCY